MAREIIVVKGYPGTEDGGVPNFGPERPEYRPIAQRRKTADTTDFEARLRLEQSAVKRALHFAYDIGQVEDVQMHFPLAEHYQHFPFETHHWDTYGNMESERARMELMLDTYLERSFPTAFRPFVEQSLTTHRRDGHPTVLQAWAKASPAIADTAKGIYTDIKDDMLANKKPDVAAVALGYQEGYPGAFQSDPILYATSSETRDQEKQLWGQALDQITAELQERNFDNLGAFLSLYGRIKDPITPLTSTLSEQVTVFKYLFRNARAELKKQGVTDIADERGKTLITQLALESSFLALPSAKDIFYVRGDADEGGEHQELPYVYVNLKDLPRGEFTHPAAVLPRIQELLDDADKRGRLVVTPLAVSHFQTPGEASPTMFLIDGNNRATSLMVLQYIYASGCTYDTRLNQDAITAFMKKHQLHPGWERELVLTLGAKPYTDRNGVVQPGFDESLFNRITASRERLARDVEAKAPALLVQEANFHTVIVDQAVTQRPLVPLLQPMHQSIYNHDGLGIAMAIPPKNQTHGRALGNNIRIQVEPTAPQPIRLFSSRRYRVQEERVS